LIHNRRRLSVIVNRWTVGADVTDAMANEGPASSADQRQTELVQGPRIQISDDDRPPVEDGGANVVKVSSEDDNNALPAAHLHVLTGLRG